MNLPVYTELSNFSTRVNGKKITTDISVVLIINSGSDPVDIINSVFQTLSKTRYKGEFILINMDKAGYQYDKLLSAFPVMRVLLPKNKINLKDAIALAVAESLSNNILFVDENCIIRALSLEVLEMYLSETSFGILIPLLINEKEEVIPNVIKGDISDGFINTISMDIVGTAVTSIYPKYFCFILNRDAYLSRNIEISDYDNPQYTLLELGYKFWKEGFIITQARNFKIQYYGEPVKDISEDYSERDYFLFNLSNIIGREAAKGRGKIILWTLFKLILSLRLKKFAVLINILKNNGKFRENIVSKPVEDFTIISIINKDIK